MTDLTIVVTNFGRAEMLTRCLNSIIQTGCRNIVVSSMCPGPEEERVFNRFRGVAGLSFYVTALPNDLGVNELWLHGVYRAWTKYVLILHDDDYLAPELRQEWPDLHKHLENGCGLVSWKGSMSKDDGTIVPTTYIQGDSRVMSTAALSQVLQRPNTGPVSPVVSVFRREDAIHFLKEAEEKLREPRAFTRPTMVLGNEMLLYLRVCEKYDYWYYLAKPLTFYGAHSGSETWSHVEKGKEKQLCETFNIVRDYCRKNRPLGFKPAPRLLRFWNTYIPENPERARQIRYAESTWEQTYSWGDIMPFPIHEGMLSRTSKTELDDTRPMPYLRDIFDWASRLAAPEDIVIFTNSDTCAVPDLAQKVRERFNVPGLRSAFAWRHNFYVPLRGHLKTCDQGFKDGGVDLIAFRPAWWREVREFFPDMLLACEAWDWVLRLLVAESQPGLPVELDGLIFHEWHGAPWRDTTFRYTNPGQKHNRRLGTDFFRKRGDNPSLAGL